MDHLMLARVYSLVAEMEALKTEIEALKRYWGDETGDHVEKYFQEKADQLRNVGAELQTIGRG